MKIFDKITHLTHVVTKQCFYVMFTLVVMNIFLRYVFNINFIFMQELVMYMHAFVFLFGISICLKDDKHVRIDVISNKLDKKIKRVIEIGNIKIDLKKLFIYRNNESLKINSTEKLILEKMINSPGKIFKREEIVDLIDLSKERSIDVIVTRLRKKIEENPKSPKYLQTIRGEGYVLWIE